MTVDEALSEFNKLLAKPHPTLDDLADIVNKLSVVGEIAPKDAVTHLYTCVGNKDFITPSVRALDHTDAFGQHRTKLLQNDEKCDIIRV